MLITIGSVTTATRLSRIIERETGQAASVIHTPTALNKGGCSYSVRISDIYKDRVRNIIQEYKLPVKRLYSERLQNGKYVYNAIS